MKGISNVKQFLVHRSGCSFAEFGTVGSFILTGSDNESSKIYAIEHEVGRNFCFILLNPFKTFNPLSQP